MELTYLIIIGIFASAFVYMLHLKQKDDLRNKTIIEDQIQKLNKQHDENRQLKHDLEIKSLLSPILEIKETERDPKLPEEIATLIENEGHRLIEQLKNEVLGSGIDKTDVSYQFYHRYLDVWVNTNNPEGLMDMEVTKFKVSFGFEFDVSDFKLKLHEKIIKHYSPLYGEHCYFYAHEVIKALTKAGWKYRPKKRALIKEDRYSSNK